MRAVRVLSRGGPAALVVDDIDEPRPGDDTVLIDVVAAGVNFPDLLLSQGTYQIRPDLPFVLGGELAGVVVAAPAVSGFSPGDRVAATTTTGAFAELAAVDPDTVYRLPPEVDLAAGACLPMNYLTMSFALRDRGRLLAGESVLVHGAAGGLGSAAVQLCAALGARVYSVVSTAAKAEFVRKAGSDEVVPVEGFKDAIMDLTGGAGVDMVVDPVGGSRFLDSLRCLAPLGRLLVLGFTAGEIPTVKVNRLLLNNIDVRGVGWGAYADRVRSSYRRHWDHLVPMLERGLITPPIDRVYPLDQAADAIGRLASREVLGKVVVAVRSDLEQPPTARRHSNGPVPSDHL